jgi:hypothetical protein
MLHTTFNLLRRAGACTKGYRKLAEHLGGVEVYGRDKPIALATVLDRNGLSEALWSLRATIEPAEVLSRDFARHSAASVLHLADDPRSTAAVEIARLQADAAATNEESNAAEEAAWTAAREAGRDFVKCAARSAAASAVGATAWAAAKGAVGGAVTAAVGAAAGPAARGVAKDAARAAFAGNFRARLLAHDPETNPLGAPVEALATVGA